MNEFGKNLEIFFVNDDRTYKRAVLADLLPYAFGPEDLPAKWSGLTIRTRSQSYSPPPPKRSVSWAFLYCEHFVSYFFFVAVVLFYMQNKDISRQKANWHCTAQRVDEGTQMCRKKWEVDRWTQLCVLLSNRVCLIGADQMSRKLWRNCENLKRTEGKGEEETHGRWGERQVEGWCTNESIGKNKKKGTLLADDDESEDCSPLKAGASLGQVWTDYGFEVIDWIPLFFFTPAQEKKPKKLTTWSLSKVESRASFPFFSFPFFFLFFSFWATDCCTILHKDYWDEAWFLFFFPGWVPVSGTASEHNGRRRSKLFFVSVPVNG